MKRYVTRFWLLIMAVMMMCTAVFAEGVGTLGIVDDYRFTVSGGNVWVVSGNDVTVYNDGLTEVTAEFTVENDWQFIAANDYGMFMLCNEGGDQFISWIAVDGSELARFDVGDELCVVRMAASEEAVLLVIDPEGAADGRNEEPVYINGELYVLSLRDGSVIYAEAADGVNIADIGSGKIAAYSFYNQELVIIDAATLKPQGSIEMNVECVPAILPDGSIFVLTTDYMSSAVAHIDGDEIAAVFEDAVWLNGLQAGGSFLYTKNMFTGELICIPAEKPESSGGVITVAFEYGYEMSDERLACAKEMTEKAFPGYEIEFVEISDDDAVITSLMAREAEYDILFLRGSGGVPDPQVLYTSGALADLNASPEVAAAMDAMIDIEGQFSYEGALFAVPAHSTAMLFKVNRPLFEELGLSVPEAGWTWNDFFALGEQVASLRANGEDVILLQEYDAPFFLTQYHINELANGEINYHDERFVNVAENYRLAVDSGIILNSSDAMFDDPEPMNALFVYDDEVYHADMSDFMAMMIGMPVSEYMLPPVYRDHVKPLVQWETVSVNAYIDAPEACFAFVANYISADVLMTDAVAFTEGLMLDCASFDDVSGDLYMPEEYPTAEKESFWLSVLTGSIPDRQVIEFTRTQKNELFPQYLAGEITVDELCGASQELIDMMITE